MVLVPGVLALLPEYAGLDDPVPDLRRACLEAVAWLGDIGTGVHASTQGLRLARHLAAETGAKLDLVAERPDAMLVVANGSATRTARAPGHLDERATAFDHDLRRALTTPDPAALAGVDQQLAEDLWADVDSLVWLGKELLTESHDVHVDYDDAPFGVQYWVMRWECES